MSEIKWAYDAQTGSFSALPASPWLLPALGLLFLAPLIERIATKIERRPRPLPANFDPVLHEKNRQIYHKIMHKKKLGIQLSVEESLTLISIRYPPWAEPGETWSY